MKKLLLMFFLLFAGGSAAAQDLFPVFGMTLGETTRQQASQLGYRSTNSKYPECYDVGTWDFWDHDKDGVFEQLYLTYTDDLPAQWTSQGLSWSLSYDGWQSLFRRMGYTIDVKEYPSVGTFSGRSCLKAEFYATNPSNGLQFRLDFNYGNDNGEGYSTSSPSSLYSMTLVATRGSVRGSGTASTQSYYASTQSPASSSQSAAPASGSLFPLQGIVLGETTRSQLEAQGHRATDKYPNYYHIETGNGTNLFCVNNNIVYKMSTILKSDVPPQWIKAGFDPSLSYDEWLSLFRSMGYSIEVRRAPTVGQYSGRSCLDARFIATDNKSGMRFDMEFKYGNDHGEGYSTSSKNSLFYFSVEATRGSLRGVGIASAGAGTSVAQASGSSAASSAQGPASAANTPKYREIAGLSENLRAVTPSGGGFVGFADAHDNLIIPVRYAHPTTGSASAERGRYFFVDGVSVVSDGNNSWGVIDQNGNQVLPFNYRVNAYCGLYEGDYFVFLGKFGSPNNGYKTFYMIDFAGNVLYKCKNTYNSKPIAKIKAFYNKTGKKIIEANRAAGRYDTVMTQIAEAKQAAADRSSQLYAQAQAQAARLRQQQLEQQRLENSFKAYAQKYVEEQINKWQIKGEYEKTSEWRARVNEATRRQKARQLTQEAESKFIAERSSRVKTSYAIDGAYDADNETYCISTSQFGKLLVPVPRSSAKQFRDQWQAITKTPRYFIEDDNLALASVTFRMPDGKEFRYSNRASLNYTVAQVEYNFNPIEIITDDDEPSPSGRQNISTTKLVAGTRSDVDITVPQGSKANPSTFAVIIANENYDNAGRVEFALNDGKTFKEYCSKTLGIPEKNIRLYDDATFVTIKRAINWIEQVVASYGPEAHVIFYYAGHGIPDEKTQHALLLPVDGIPTDPTTCYSVDRIYDRLGAMKAARVTVFMDSCFSGSQRSGQMLASARGVAIKARPMEPQGNMVVFTAAQGDETAYPYREKSHGLFTYFLLKKLQTTAGDVSLGELGDYITRNVKMESLTANDKSQTPSVKASAGLGDEWQSLKL